VASATTHVVGFLYTKMKIKLSDKNKFYWINYFGFWLIFAGVLFLVSVVINTDGEPNRYDFKTGYIVIATISTFILAHKIARSYERSVEIDELRVKENMEYKEFNAKYGKMMEIYNK
jgi:hypothetical protein